jgi:hypothetical protein
MSHYDYKAPNWSSKTESLIPADTNAARQPKPNPKKSKLSRQWGAAATTDEGRLWAGRPRPIRWPSQRIGASGILDILSNQIRPNHQARRSNLKRKVRELNLVLTRRGKRGEHEDKGANGGHFRRRRSQSQFDEHNNESN